MQIAHLRAARAKLAARGAQVVVLVRHAKTCAEVARVVRGGEGVTRGFATLPMLREFGIDSTPTMLVARGGKLRARLVGVASVEEVLDVMRASGDL